MARDAGLEHLVSEDLATVSGLNTRPMFGGLVWLHEARLLCGARHDGLLVRLGAGRDGWALALPGVVPMRSGRRPMRGWVWVGESTLGDDDARRRLLAAALDFVRALGSRPSALPRVPWDFLDHPTGLYGQPTAFRPRT